MSIESKILQILKPAIPLDEISVDDLQKYESSTNSNSSSYNKDEKGDEDRAAPDKTPIIKIRDYFFITSEIDFIQIKVGSSFLPEIICSLIPQGGIFLSKSFPKDGDLLSYFLASKSNEFKPIRIDFEIIRISSQPSVDSQGDISQYTFTGIMRIPLLYGEWIKSFNQVTSLDCLLEVCQEINLGFATNETSTNDKMTWINPYETWKTFMEKVTTSSWKDQSSFYTSFIDQYYNFNFVNVNNQFAGENVIDEGFVKSMLQSRKLPTDGPQDNLQTKLVLSNNDAARNSNLYIESYTLLNDSGEIVMNNGYGRYMQFYSPDTKKYYNDQLIEPINNSTGDDLPLRGRNNEDYQKKVRKYKWMGIDRPSSKGNYHDNYLYAKIQNLQNNSEIKKMTLLVQLQMCNFNFYRFQKIPVVITVTGNPQRNQSNTDNTPNQDGEEGKGAKTAEITVDPFLTGFYVIDEILYIYDNNVFRQQLKLIRREWPLTTSDQVVSPENK